LIPPVLQLAIALGIVRVLLTILFPIAAMLFTPLLLTIADDLGVLVIGADFLAVIIGATSPLAIRLATDTLLWAKRGRLE
jgi:hypothetical protein